MANDLTAGTRRVGALIDFDPATPEVTVTLEHSERGIGVTVPWTGPESPYSAWFLGRDGLDADDDSEVPGAPRRLLFSDSHGPVLLVGCRARGFHSTWRGPGNGHVWAKAAVMGVDDDFDYEQPHGVQTDISGLREWLRTSSWDEAHDWGPDGLAMTLKSARRPAVEVGEVAGLRLDLRPGYGVTHQDARDRIVLEDYVRCTTVADEPHTWTEHLSVHHAVRDLLMLSRWHQERCDVVKASRHDDRLRTLDDKDHGVQWREVVEPADDPITPASERQEHLIKFADIGATGLGEWLKLRDVFARALDPVITSIAFSNERPTTVLAHTGPGLEALGYLLMIRDGMAPKNAGRASLRERLDRILVDVATVVPFDGNTWASMFVETYNGLKHANRAEPEGVDVMNAWREGALAVRAWVALELGISGTVVSERLTNDPQRHPYVVAD